MSYKFNFWLSLKLNIIPTFQKNYVTVQPCDWQKREIEKVFSSDYPHGNT